MRFLRHYERHDFPSTSINLKAKLQLVVWLYLSSTTAHATPVRRQDVELVGRADRTSGFTPSIWASYLFRMQIAVPIVIVILVLMGLVLLSWSNKTVRRLLSHRDTSAGPQGPRELTAEQLAGTINANSPNSNSNVPAGRPRRTRRPRRTPSQMSVTSLPAYNKEPGEQELVISRGRDMEDASMPTALVEEDAESSMHSRDRSQASRYSPMPTSPNDLPLLQDDCNLSVDLQTPPPQNHDDAGTSQENMSLMRVATASSDETPDPRGEAPPYFEVVDANDQVPASTELPQDEPQTPPDATMLSNTSPSLPPPSSPERRSGIRTFFHRMSVAGAPRGLNHARGDSAASALSSTQSHGEPSSASPITSRHRASPSAASSFFRTLSRQRSQSTQHSGNNSIRLNSPSLISLNSISSPLTHTAMRTEFTYPKSGPTPEQLKVISSRESLARFAVPYGADAIAFAASTSGVDLNQAPPDFETIIGRSTSALGSSSFGLDDGSSLSLHRRGDSAGGRAISPLVSSVSGGNPEEVAAPSPVVAEASASTRNRSTLAASDPISPPIIPTSIPPSATNINNLPWDTSTSEQNQTPANPSISTIASSSSDKPSDNITEFGKLSAPPPSFHPHDTPFSVRSESRASVHSYQTFETAAESLSRRHPGFGSDEEDEDEPKGPKTPTTPKIDLPLSGGSAITTHVQEPTDTTIILDRDGRGISAAP